MTKRQLLLVAGTIVLAACGTGTGVCETAGFSENENHNRDQVGQVECRDVEGHQPASAPAPRVGDAPR
jgi:hypothetical protein